MLPDQQEVLVAFAIAVIAPAVGGLIGVPLRWLFLAGGWGAVVLWLVMTIPAPSGDREIGKSSYAVLYGALVALWFGVWALAAYLGVNVRRATKPGEEGGPHAA
jgi:4-hydroxybenzoate polyprenyltransferase